MIFCGDLNDEPLAATTQIIQGPGGSEIDFRPGSGFRIPDRGDGYRMWNLSRLLPPEGPNYSRIYRGRGELIDHIFASHRLVNPENVPAALDPDPRGYWAAAGFVQRRELVRLVVERVEISPGRPGMGRFDPARVRIDFKPPKRWTPSSAIVCVFVKDDVSSRAPVVS